MSEELLATSTKELPILRKGDSGAAVKLLQNILMIGNPSYQQKYYGDQDEFRHSQKILLIEKP